MHIHRYTHIPRKRKKNDAEKMNDWLLANRLVLFFVFSPFPIDNYAKFFFDNDINRQ